MKIAITGHTAGIGQALAEIYSSNGHEIVGLSRRNGYNIRSTSKVVSMIEPCDIFINNAQVGFAQTELLFAVYKL
jgi:short-subunit dehydrogenase